ncbi:Bug family tripartite tricarboxylate transporter substrate binding protein [Cupriavidus oxalaticus]|uniref:Exported protein n=2 Tax=Cupriavidus oxalaticus TaxID=96344 RepID=A0A976BJP0_9BURK|nr:tripartite tricarboxylate transporter substrate binding protein [Cupriavidus oxalaticus]QRQ85011.1 tripartite tricarboxylate transporter substrate binding protein [Cupriavidus oxalaticus]QRQ90901.1 tripartite tricarboxylate transporter substrate binding protein [Cupriavidus oxalaticus]WQD85430.1 tripartite tricarboxylate transporter substrate binding protein [Cupriavidus oxalaticus]SPC21976.1 putative exported protein [Cupriavidus oxalaticus]
MPRLKHLLHLLRSLPLCCSLLLASPASHAEPAWPAKPVRLVVPFAAGGSTDLIARKIAEELGERIKGTVIVENRPGAGGTVGSEYVARQAGDGYTILMGSVSTHAVAPSLFARLPYDPIKDFTPLALVATIPNVLVVNNTMPVSNMKDFVGLIKREPGKFAFASNGNGTSNHLAMELFKATAGVSLTHVPYKGSGPAMADLLGGHVNSMMDVVMTSYSYVRNGKLKPIAVTSLTRSPLLPNVPTVAESGYPGFEAIVWFGLFGPANMPADIAGRLSRELAAVLQGKKMTAYLTEQGAQPSPMSAAEFSQFIRKDMAKWHTVAVAAGIKPE